MITHVRPSISNDTPIVSWDSFMIQQDKFDEFISPDEGLFERNM